VPELPTAEQQQRARALARIHGSDAVNDLSGEHVDIINEIIHAVMVLRFAQGRAHAEQMVAEYRHKLDEVLRPAELAKRRELSRAAAKELRGSPPS
jgi:hypothetical protein